MAINALFNNASVFMTVISLITFLGILWWTFIFKSSDDFEDIANLPFKDDMDEVNVMKVREQHG